MPTTSTDKIGHFEQENMRLHTDFRARNRDRVTQLESALHDCIRTCEVQLAYEQDCLTAHKEDRVDHAFDKENCAVCQHHIDRALHWEAMAVKLNALLNH